MALRAIKYFRNYTRTVLALMSNHGWSRTNRRKQKTISSIGTMTGSGQLTRGINGWEITRPTSRKWKRNNPEWDNKKTKREWSRTIKEELETYQALWTHSYSKTQLSLSNKNGSLLIPTKIVQRTSFSMRQWMTSSWLMGRKSSSLASLIPEYS